MIEHAQMVRLCRSEAGYYPKSVGLNGSRAARVIGYAAHELTEHRLAALADRFGGLVINGSHFPGTELRSYQVVAHYGRVLLGRATIADRRELPTRNITRSNGASLNRPFTLKPELPGLLPAPAVDSVLYALLLTCRDRRDASKLFEVAIGIIENDFSGFIFYQEIDQFIAGYEDHESKPVRSAAKVETQPIGLELRKGVQPFVAPENPSPGAADEKEPA
jgi:hypothetical protein